jgi:predicted component of type VI protein secretion system
MTGVHDLAAHVNHSSTAPQFPGMDRMQTLAAVRALRDLLYNPERNDWTSSSP